MKHHPAHGQLTNYGSTTASSPSQLPYPILYAGDFEIGKEEHARILLDLWKDFDVNTLDKGAHVFADEVTMEFCDGSSVTKSRDDFMAYMQEQRNSVSSFESTIDAVVSLKPKGKEESWACVWGKQTSITPDNKKQQVYINENWMFDKEGKVSYIKQFNAVINNPS